ncbi:MAG: tellurite resistance TerB family protein [Alphaproteobacteria bacterium]|nr:tellurite resistance TerB family protein [Alphaproteobacteria bacterium]MBV9063800.1 tellurite resistance TerB family protein [Alphaproteobacteria bacterium]
MKTINHHAALIYVMVIVSASDGVMSDRELQAIGDATKKLPVFRGFEEHHLLPVAQECAAMLREPDSLNPILLLVKEALPPHLRETAYLLAMEIALTDSRIMLEELRVLDLLRHALGIDRLVAAALERAARARYQVSAEG